MKHVVYATIVAVISIALHWNFIFYWNFICRSMVIAMVVAMIAMVIAMVIIAAVLEGLKRYKGTIEQLACSFMPCATVNFKCLL